MSTTTAIEWTDHTFSPWWGCSRVSPACNHCYAEALAKRYGHDVWGNNTGRRRLSDNHWRTPGKWNRQAELDGRPHLVFCGSMCDVFEDRDDLLEERARLWGLVTATHHLIWQLLTKRPENVLGMVPHRWLEDWPSNVWVGTTVEDQTRALERIPHLLQVPAPVRFLSCEPLLGEVRLSRWLWRVDAAEAPEPAGAIGWVIAGGESGPGHRDLDLRHARILRRECAGADVPFFFKQDSGQQPGRRGRADDELWVHQFPAEARR